MQTTHTHISIASLVIPLDRQRQEFDEVALLELASSIKEHGLFHAVQVRQDGKTLVTGERRVRAILQHLVPFQKAVLYAGETLPVGHIPVIQVNSDDPLALEEIELDENLRRKDLTWQEMAKTTARLHALRHAQTDLINRTAKLLEQPVVPSHTVADTAKEVRGSSIGDYHTTTRNEIIVAQHMDKPEVANAPTLKDAFKALKKIEDASRNRALAAAIGETYSTDQHTALNMNCLTYMADSANHGKFDVICTDPPYGMGAQDFGDAGGKMTGIDHIYDDSYESWKKLMEAWCPLAFLITKSQAHAYVWCDIDNFHELKRMMQAAGWYVFRTPLTNYKRNSGRVPLPDQGPRRQTEWCLYAIKGKKQVTAIYSDLISTDSDEQLTHGAQKPVALFEDLLRRSVKPGDSVLDCFAGTGPIFPAAHTFKCYATGLEMNPTYYGICLQRLAELGKQGELLK